MRIPRIYHPEPLATGHIIELSKSAANHVATVLRMKMGQSVILFDGSGTDFNGTITALSKKQVSVLLNTTSINQTESPLATHLGQAICRSDKMDWIIQKSVELGVNQITPIMSQRSQCKWSTEQQQKKWQHWHNIIISSCEQCGRSILPKLHPILRLTNWLNHAPPGHRLILDPAANHSVNFTNAQYPITLLCGPESGFDQQEVDAAIQAGFEPIQIGPRVLRAETTSIAILSCLQWQMGDFGH